MPPTNGPKAVRKERKKIRLVPQPLEPVIDPRGPPLSLNSISRGGLLPPSETAALHAARLL